MAGYRMAIIGYGGMGSWHHSSVRENVKSFEVVGAWDIREEARKEAESKGLYAYSSLHTSILTHLALIISILVAKIPVGL